MIPQQSSAYPHGRRMAESNTGSVGKGDGRRQRTEQILKERSRRRWKENFEAVCRRHLLA